MRRHLRAVIGRSEGASLVEALIATALVVTVTAGVAHLLVWTRRTVWSAGARSTAVIAASQKIEQLRALPWYADDSGAPVSDVTADLSIDPPSSSGSGLQVSPEGALAANTAGFVDYLTRSGAWCGTGPRPPGCAVFVRRWSIEAFAADPADTVVISVLVFAVTDAGSPEAVRRGVRLTTIRTRTIG